MFLGGMVTYHNQAKQDLLEVPAAMLAAEGAVSEAVACAMAAGARHRFGADWAASLTGIAGPGGGSDEKPVGTVWVGISGPAGTTATKLQLFGSRTEIRARAVQSALLRLLQALAGPLP